MRTCLFVVLLALPALAAPRRVAVLEFENQVQGETLDRVYFSDEVRGAIGRALPEASVMTRESAGFASNSQRRGVTPLVLLLKRSGNSSARSLTVVDRRR
jgi:hypothetical protein